MKWLRLITIFLVVIIVSSASTAIILALVYSVDKGKVDGTGFIYHEIDGAGSLRYDIDDFGNIYFAVASPFSNGIVIYNNYGDYKYTLPIQTSGTIGVKIDNENNILVCYAREDKIEVYNSNGGGLIDQMNNIDYDTRKSFFPYSNDNIRRRDGYVYTNVKGKITREKNGLKDVVFTIPAWQSWKRTTTLMAILTVVILFLKGGITQAVIAYKTKKVN